MIDNLDSVEHRELQPSAIAIDGTNQFLALVSRRYVAIVDTTFLDNVLRRIARNSNSKWEVNCCVWAPHQSLLALTNNQNLEIYSWGSDNSLRLLNSVPAHSRIVSSVDWCTTNVNLFVSASVDDFLYVWDIRDLRKPAVSLHSIADASQARWSRCLENVLASTHHGEIRLWDIRKSVPLSFTVAHLSKISSLDWSPHHDTQFVTASQDSTLKLWNMGDLTKPLVEATVAAPVWKAKFTPFGDALVTSTMQQLSSRRGDHALTVWSCRDLTNPVHQFAGHSDAVLDFAWRAAHNASGDEWQLISVGKDAVVRRWRFDAGLQQHIAGLTPLSTTTSATSEVLTLPGSTLAVVRKISNQIPVPLQANGDGLHPHGNSNNVLQSTDGPPSGERSQRELFNLANIRNLTVPNLTVDDVDIERRNVVVTVQARRQQTIVLNVSLPEPSLLGDEGLLDFKFAKGSTLTQATKHGIIKQLLELSAKHKNNVASLEACLTALPNLIEQFVTEPESLEQYQGSVFTSPHSFTTPGQLLFAPPVQRDANIPFPRTSGARFCSVGVLVCFGRVVSAPSTVASTPRSMASLYGLKENTYSTGSQLLPHEVPSVSAFYQKEKTQSLKRKQRTPASFGGGHQKQKSKDDTIMAASAATKSASSDVFIYDIGSLLPYNVELASSYVLSHQDLPSICAKNASVATSLARRDLSQVWTILMHAVSPDVRPSLDPDLEVPWSMHPFGRNLLNSIIKHYAKLGDVQTLTMLSCVLGGTTDLQSVRPGYFRKVSTSLLGTDGTSVQGAGSKLLTLRKKKSTARFGGPSPYNTIHSSDNLFESWSGGGGVHRQRSSSLNDPDAQLLESSSSPSTNSQLPGWVSVLSPMDEEVVVTAQTPKSQQALEQDSHDRNTKLLNPDVLMNFETPKQVYADILYRWGFLNRRAEVVKYSHRRPEPHRGLEFIAACETCHQQAGAICSRCKSVSLVCVICEVSVRGLCTVCILCGHGGHLRHMEDWYRKYPYCPTGCGCQCII